MTPNYARYVAYGVSTEHARKIVVDAGVEGVAGWSRAAPFHCGAAAIIALKILTTSARKRGNPIAQVSVSRHEAGTRRPTPLSKTQHQHNAAPPLRVVTRPASPRKRLRAILDGYQRHLSDVQIDEPTPLSRAD